MSPPFPPPRAPRQFALALEGGPLEGLSPAQRAKACLHLTQLLLQAAEIGPGSHRDD
jgi:hypothetical protein